MVIEKEQLIYGGNSFTGAYVTRWPAKEEGPGEDAAIAISSPDGLYGILGVADGVGGSYRGDIGSKYVLNEFKKVFWDEGYDFLLSLKDQSSEDICKQLKIKTNRFIKDVIEELTNKAERDTKTKNRNSVYQSTVTFVIIIEGRPFYTWLGDSRIFTIINGRLFPLSYDHSLDIFDSFAEIQNLQDNFNPKNARKCIEKNIISRGGGILYYIGAYLEDIPSIKWFDLDSTWGSLYPEAQNEVKINSLKYTSHVLLTSDGILDLIEIWYLEQLLTFYNLIYENPRIICEKLLEFLFPHAIDDMSIAIWRNPLLSRQDYSGIGLVQIPFGNLIEMFYKPKIVSYFDALKIKINENDPSLRPKQFLKATVKDSLRNIIDKEFPTNKILFKYKSIKKKTYEFLINAQLEQDEPFAKFWNYHKIDLTDKFKINQLFLEPQVPQISISNESKSETIIMQVLNKEKKYSFKIIYNRNYLNPSENEIISIMPVKISKSFAIWILKDLNSKSPLTFETTLAGDKSSILQDEEDNFIQEIFNSMILNLEAASFLQSCIVKFEKSNFGLTTDKKDENVSIKQEELTETIKKNYEISVENLDLPSEVIKKTIIIQQKKIISKKVQGLEFIKLPLFDNCGNVNQSISFKAKTNPLIILIGKKITETKPHELLQTISLFHK